MFAKPGHKTSHCVEVIKICLCIRATIRAVWTVVILQANTDNRLVASDRWAFGKHLAREPKRQIGAYPVSIGIKTNPLQILHRFNIAIAAVCRQAKAGFDQPPAQWVINWPDSNADENDFGLA